MSIFNRFNIDRDRLHIVFSEDGKYVVSYGSTIIPYNRLDRKSQKRLDLCNNELLVNKELYEKEMKKIKVGQRFRKLKSMGYTCNSFEAMGDIKGSMSDEIKVYLERLIKEEDVLLGIHRVGDISETAVIDILQNGLKMTGHIESGYAGSIDLANNVSFYADNEKIIKELMYADLYKNSIGSLLIRIPDEDLKGSIYVTDQEEYPRLNPKYILGFVKVYPNHHIERITSLNELIKANNVEEIEENKGRGR